MGVQDDEADGGEERERRPEEPDGSPVRQEPPDAGGAGDQREEPGPDDHEPALAHGEHEDDHRADRHEDGQACHQPRRRATVVRTRPV